MTVSPIIKNETENTNSTVTLIGTADSTDTISIYDDETLLGTALSNVTGAWTFTSPTLAAGVYHFTATATDAAGVISTPSPDPVVVTAPVILMASPMNVPLDNQGTTVINDALTLVGTGVAGSTITVYDGATDRGATTANSSGTWTFTTSALADGAHSFTATATSSGATSAASSALPITIDGSIANFSSLTDQWSAPITVGGQLYNLNNANTDGNAPWAVTEVNDHTLQFELQPDDTWTSGGDTTHRTEIAGTTIFSDTDTVNVSYQLTVQPGTPDLGLTWQVFGQFQAYNITGLTPPLAIHLTGANGVGGGDYLAVAASYVLPGQSASSPISITPTGNPYSGSYLYVSPEPIVQGETYSVQIEASFQNNANGFLEVWVNGTEIVNYRGPLGYGDTMFYKEGIYEGASPTQTITVDYANTYVTATPGAPLILTDTVNGNQAMLSGTAEANSTVTVYDGTTALGNTTVSGSGAWSFETASLSAGIHNLTATITDSAGNVSAASSVSSATIAAFTGPIVTGVTASSVSGEATAGTTITFTLDMSAVTTVAGTPTLTLSDGGVATYVSGSGTNALIFKYTVESSDSSTTALAITGVSLPSGSAITGADSIAVILTGAAQTFNTITIDSALVSTPSIVYFTPNANGSFTIVGTAAPDTTVYELQTLYTGYNKLEVVGTAAVNASGVWTYTTPSLITTSGAWVDFSAYDENALGDISATTTVLGGPIITNMLPSPVILTSSANGNVLTLTGVMPTVYGGTGSAGETVLIYDGAIEIGSTTTTTDGQWAFTTSALANGVHSFIVESQNTYGDSAPSIADTVSVSGSVVSNAITPPQTGSTTSASGLVVSSVAASPSSGVEVAGSVITLTLNMNETVVVTGTPTLSLNDGGKATYVSGSGTSSLVFTYTVASGQNVAHLGISAVNLPGGAAITDSADNAATTTGALITFTSLQIDTTAPTVSSVVATGTGITSGTGNVGVGSVVTLTVNMSSAVTLSGGTPTLTLNDGGTATYVSGSGSSALVFTYTVASGQNTADLTVTAFNANSATIVDAAGNAAVTTGAVTNPAGTLQVATVTSPVISNYSVNTNNVSLGGTAQASSSVTVYDGSNVLGTAPVNGSGVWTYTTSTLAGGSHALTAVDTYNGNTSAAVSNGATVVSTGAHQTLSLTSTNIGDTVSAVSGDTINVAGNGQSGPGDSIFMSSGYVGVSAGAAADIGGNANTVTATTNDGVGVWGNSNNVTIGAGSSVWLNTGTGNTVSAGGNGDNVYVAGNGQSGPDDSVFMSSGYVSVAAGAAADIGGNADTVTAATNDGVGIWGNSNKVTIGAGSAVWFNTGTGNSVTAGGSGDNVYVAGNGQSGPGDSVFMSSGYVSVAAGAAANIGGNANTVTATTNDGVGIWGNSNNVTIGAGSSVWLNTGTGNTVSAGTGDNVYIAANTSETITGSNLLIYASDNDTITITGSHDTIVCGSGDTVNITGTYDPVSATSSTINYSGTNTGDVVTGSANSGTGWANPPTGAATSVALLTQYMAASSSSASPASASTLITTSATSETLLASASSAAHH